MIEKVTHTLSKNIRETRIKEPSTSYASEPKSRLIIRICQTSWEKLFLRCVHRGSPSPFLVCERRLSKDSPATFPGGAGRPF